MSAETHISVPGAGRDGRFWLLATFCLLTVVAAGSVLPGAGLVLAAVYWFTALRHHRGTAVVMVAAGLVLTALAAVTLMDGTESHSVSTPTVVND